MGTLGTIITQTPFRLNFFGGGTDFPGYFQRQPGAVLGTTINKYTYVTVNSLERLLEKRIRMSYSRLELVDEPSELSHPIVRAVLTKHRDLLNGGFLDMHSFADLPAGSGVGSSSCFAVGFLNALYLLHKIYRSPEEIAVEAIDVERNILQEAGGWQDQIHAAYGGFNRIAFQGDSFRVTPLCLPFDRMKALERSCMFFFTGLVRSSASVHSQGLSQSVQAPSSKDAYLAEMYASVAKAEEILTAGGQTHEMLAEFGRLLDQNWHAKKNLATGVSNTTIDEIYSAALEAGAYGGKLLGAGSGGFMVFIVPPERQDSVAAVLSKLKRIHFGFEKSGSRVVFAN